MRILLPILRLCLTALGGALEATAQANAVRIIAGEVFRALGTKPGVIPN
jgi:hypothetical protein